MFDAWHFLTFLLVSEYFLCKFFWPLTTQKRKFERTAYCEFAWESRLESVSATWFFLCFSNIKPAEKATMGLARVGSRAALSFAFAFLRRAWRSGEDSDLCSELLQESLEALQSLPEASLFEDGSVSSVWLDVVERAAKFLNSVVAG